MASRSTQFLDLVSGRLKGLPYGAVRFVLALLAIPYRLVVAVRNVCFDWVPGMRRRLSCPVISVGNITVGGTGKTPVVIKIASLLNDRKMKVAILSRGYRSKSADAAQGGAGGRADNDETLVMRRRCPQTEVVVNPRRVAGGKRAIANGAEVLLLDDGFQHRRLRRDLDIVLIDATVPFGYGRMLPRGLLREPVGSLQRADLVVLTHSDQVDASDKSLLLGRLQRLSNAKPVIQAVHRISGLTDIFGNLVDIEPRDMLAVIFAGIANFSGFRRSVEEIGVKVAAAYEYPDHHDYTAEEIAGLKDVALTLEANALLTTEKDAVKLLGRWDDSGCRLIVLRLDVEFEESGEKILTEMLDRVLAQKNKS